MEWELPNIFTERETSFFFPSEQAVGMLNLYRMSPLARWWGGGHTVQVSTLFKLNPPLVLLGLL